LEVSLKKKYFFFRVDIILHVQCGDIEKLIKKRQAITDPILCEECQLKKRKIASKGLVVKPLLSKDFNSRGQLDLVDMQSMRDGDFKFILHYQDHLTKFAVLRPLTL
jgi:hypothetical protein